MTIYQTPFLSDPIHGEKVSPDTFSYWRARAKREAYDLVLSEFIKSGITKTELAKRLGKTLPEVSRMLGGPANWTIATVADLLFAISGGIPKWGIAIPKRMRRNDKRPAWLDAHENLLLKESEKSQNANSSFKILLGSSPPPPPNNNRNEFGLGAR